MNNHININALIPHGEMQTFKAGERLFNQGDKATGCFIVTRGEVVTHCYDLQMQTQSLLQSYCVGDVVGAIGVIDLDERSLSAIAQGDCEALYLSQQKLNDLLLNWPKIYQKFIRLASATLAAKFRELQTQASAQALLASRSPLVDEIVARAVVSQQKLLALSEMQIDSLLNAIAEAVYLRADVLAQMVVDETGMGMAEHKRQKIKLGTLDVASSLVGQPGNGEITLESPGVESMAMPIGIVFGMIPVTNPVETIVFKSLISLKARNAIIISSHRKARAVGIEVVDIIRSVLSSNGVDPDVVQTPQLPANRKLTHAFMHHQDVNFILATGGPSMVASAYKSGTPAIGVGKGNAPVWVCSDANIARSAEQIVASKSFDNGLVCGSENNLLVDEAVADAFTIAAEAQGAAVLTASEVEALQLELYDESGVKPDWVGQSASAIAERIGVARDYPIRLLLAPVAAGDLTSVLVREKLMPVLSLIRVRDTDEALFHARSILSIEGRGHTAIVHSEDKAKIRAFAQAVEVSRVLVNSPGTQGCIGACNGLELSWTLGCGTYGGGSTNDNVGYRHLQNTKRVAY